MNRQYAPKTLSVPHQPSLTSSKETSTKKPMTARDSGNITDAQLLAYFSTTYPQEMPWKHVHLSSKMHSTLTSALLKQRPLPQLFLGTPTPKTVTGECGKCSLPMLKGSIHTSQSSLNQSSYIFSKFLQPDYGKESLNLVATLLDLAKWKTTFGPSEQRSLMWTTKIHASYQPDGYTAK